MNYKVIWLKFNTSYYLRSLTYYANGFKNKIILMFGPTVHE